MAKNDGGQAFPSVLYSHERAENWSTDGMSLRDWFAGRVLPQIWADDRCHDEEAMTLDEMAHEAYRMADAMLAERAK